MVHAFAPLEVQDGRLHSVQVCVRERDRDTESFAGGLVGISVC